jgi:septal ring factor EnvC (AmiA/AmiB activator)
MENKIEELTKAKSEQIEKLTKIKDVLRQKLEEAKNEISELKEKLDEAKNENSELKEKISEIEENISSIDQNTTPADSVGNEQILEFLKGNRNKMDFVLKRLENLISIEVKKSERDESPKLKIVKKDVLVKEHSSEIETKIVVEIPDQKEKNKPPKSIKREPSTSKKLLSIPYPTDGTIRCPNCNKIKWKELKNKSKMISRGVYAKQYYCKTCRTEWEFEY